MVVFILFLFGYTLFTYPINGCYRYWCFFPYYKHVKSDIERDLVRIYELFIKN